MKKITLLLSVLLIGLLAACSGEPEEQPTATSEPAFEPVSTPTEIVPPTEPATLEPTPEPGYPPPEDSEPYPPPTPEEPESYPPPIAPTPTLNPYPDSEIAIIHPAGVQCEEPLYPDLEAAIAALEEGGVTVLDGESEEFLVCEACDCPTSTHYRLFIDPNTLQYALDLGWWRER